MGPKACPRPDDVTGRVHSAGNNPVRGPMGNEQARQCQRVHGHLCHPTLRHIAFGQLYQPLRESFDGVSIIRIDDADDTGIGLCSYTRFSNVGRHPDSNNRADLLIE